MRALLIVDVQNDFCEGGSLGVIGGQSVARAISEFLATPRDYAHIVATKDFHIDPGDHFSDHPDFAASWPPHCVVGTAGADFHPEFDHGRGRSRVHQGPATRRPTAASRAPTRPARRWPTGCGNAGSTRSTSWASPPTTACVATATDAVEAGFATRVLLDLTAGVARGVTAPRPSTTCAPPASRSTGLYGRGLTLVSPVHFGGAAVPWNARTPSLASSCRISVEVDLGLARADGGTVEVERIPQQPLAGRHRHRRGVLGDVVGQLQRRGQHVVGVEHAAAQPERHRAMAVECGSAQQDLGRVGRARPGAAAPSASRRRRPCRAGPERRRTARRRRRTGCRTAGPASGPARSRAR